MGARPRQGIFCLLVVLVGGAFSGDALAEPRFRIRVESDPPGATVYFDVGDEARVEVTPVEVLLAPGTYTMIFELDGYQDEVMDVTVRRTRQRQRVRAEMTRQDPAYLRVEARDGGAASVRIDGDARGETPLEIEIAPGPHLVEVIGEGQELYSEWVEVSGGDRLTVTADVGGGVAASGALDVDEETPGGLGSDEEVKVQARGGESPGMARITIGAGVEFGGRRFRFDNPRRLNEMQRSLRPYDAFGVPLFRGFLEAFPLAGSESRFLSGFGLVGTYAAAIPFDSTADESADPVRTTFMDFEVGALYRYPVSPTFFVGGRITYGGHQFDFDDGDGDPMSGIDAEVPGVNYRFIRFGAEVGGASGRYSYFAGISNQHVNQVGSLADRFQETSITGLGARAGFSANIIPSFDLRLVGSYHRYSLDFEVPDPMTATYVADGGTDQFFGLMVSGVYVY